MSTPPTERQLRAISIIESTFPYVRFNGATKREAYDFINKWMEASKKQSRLRQKVINSYNDSEYREVKHESVEKTDRERYEEYIEEVSWNYVEAAGDDGWGGIASRDMARVFHPFEDWKERNSKR